MKRLIAALTLAAGLTASSVPQLVRAGTITPTFPVTLAQTNSCALVTQPGITFTGPYTGTAIYGTGAAAGLSTVLTVTCTVNDSVVASLAVGSGANDLTGLHYLKNGATTLQYKLYTDAACTASIWNTVNTVPLTGTGLPQNIQACAVIPSAETAPAGGVSYTDTETVTVTF